MKREQVHSQEPQRDGVVLSGLAHGRVTTTSTRCPFSSNRPYTPPTAATTDCVRSR